MRVYLPSTLPATAGLLRTGEIGPGPLRGYSVTPAMREWYSSGDMEELEYVALMHAAKASLRLLQDDPSAPRRRVVLAVEVPTTQVVNDADFDEPGLVHISGPVTIRDVASGHVDDPVAAAEIAEAIAALAAADAGDADAQFVVDGADGHELLWYATQELADLQG
ncbi:MAG TPA: hypothetical protein VMA32_18285 [Streptosporangiaceae bacterium]|nr:hypothetical protein [Streptosporangiaceae bacterium]